MWSPFDGLFGRKIIDLKREMERRRQLEERRLRRLNYHLTRINAEIRVHTARLESHSEIISGRMTGGDISALRLRIFCSKPLNPHQSVAITVLDDTKLYVKGQVKWCHPVPVNETKILSPQSFGYRAEIEFTFDNWIERQELADYSRRFRQRYVFGE